MRNHNQAPDRHNTSVRPDVYKRTVREALWSRMALVSLIGTVALSAIATERNGDVKGFAEAAKATLIDTGHSVANLNIDPRISNFDVAGHKIPYPDVKVSLENTKTELVSGKPKIDTIHPGTDLAMPWAHEFSKDPAARDVTEARQDIRPLIDSIHDYEQQGYVIDAVEVQGFASDEVDKPGAGLNEVNPANIELADTRAKAAAAAVIGPEMQAEGYNLPIEIMQGRELREPEINAKVEQQAAARGLDVNSYIKAFNRHDMHFDAEELKALDHYVDERFVKVMIKMHRQAPTTEIQQQHTGGNIIIVPFFIPLWRKRKLVPLAKVKLRQKFERPLNHRVPKLHNVSNHSQIRKQPRPHNYHGSRMHARRAGMKRALLHSGR